MSMMNEEHKKAISEGQKKKLKRKPISQETKNKISKKMTKRDLSEEHKEKIKESWKKRKKSKSL